MGDLGIRMAHAFMIRGIGTRSKSSL